MAAVSELVGVLHVAGTPIRATAVRLVMDAAWSPAVAAEVTIPWTAERAALLDPDDQPRVVVEITRAWQGSLTLADLTTLWAGKTLATLTTDWAGKTLANLTADWGTVWESGYKDPDIVAADLTVRGRRVSHRDATITIRCASDELLAQGPPAGGLVLPEQPLPDRILALLAHGGIVPVAADLSAGAIFFPSAEVVPWTESVWDAASRVAAASGLRLWCDHARTWHLTNPDDAPTTTVSVTRVIGGEDETDRDGDYAEAIVWVGTGTNPDGEPLTDVKTWPSPIPTGARTRIIQHDYGQVGVGLPMPSDTELAARLARLQVAGRTAQLVAVADPTMRPGVEIETGPPSLPALAGIATRVEWELPADTMTITTGSTTEA